MHRFAELSNLEPTRRFPSIQVHTQECMYMNVCVRVCLFLKFLFFLFKHFLYQIS